MFVKKLRNQSAGKFGQFGLTSFLNSFSSREHSPGLEQWEIMKNLLGCFFVNNFKTRSLRLSC